jgi:hypothetical protein
LSVRFTRILRAGDIGPDVEGVARALCHADVFLPIAVFNALPHLTRQRLGIRKVEALEKFQRKHLLKVDGVYGTVTHTKLAPFFDSKAKTLMAIWSTPQDVIFGKLIVAMREMSDHTPGYLLGGGHGIPLDSVSPYQKLDCSSSTSKALYEAGIFDHNIAWVSGQLESWGLPGPGRYFTVYANSEHVWTRLHKSRWWRFDTSPHGDGGRGPKLRYLPRFSSTFAARHWEAM